MLPFPDIEKIAEPPTPVVEPSMPWGAWAALIAGGVIALGLLIWLGVTLLRRASLPAAPVRPEKLALRELKALRKTSAGMAPAEFAGALSGVIRSFLHRRMGLLAHYSTTPELLGRSQSRTAVPPPPMTEVFGGVLDACDGMKFGAGAAPDRAALISQAEAALLAVKHSLATPAPVAPTVMAPPMPPSISPHEPAV